MVMLARHIEGCVRNRDPTAAHNLLDSIMNKQQAAAYQAEMECHPAVMQIIDRTGGPSQKATVILAEKEYLHST